MCIEELGRDDWRSVPARDVVKDVRTERDGVGQMAWRWRLEVGQFDIRLAVEEASEGVSRAGV